MDLDWLYYAYTTILNRTEDDFWNSTPKKIYSQLKLHTDLHKKKDKNKTETLKVLD